MREGEPHSSNWMSILFFMSVMTVIILFTEASISIRGRAWIRQRRKKWETSAEDKLQEGHSGESDK